MIMLVVIMEMIVFLMEIVLVVVHFKMLMEILLQENFVM